MDSWSQYENPEEGKKREGDIHGPLSRKTITTDKRLLWPDGIVKYYIDSSLGELQSLSCTIVNQEHCDRSENQKSRDLNSE